MDGTGDDEGRERPGWAGAVRWYVALVCGLVVATAATAVAITVAGDRRPRPPAAVLAGLHGHVHTAGRLGIGGDAAGVLYPGTSQPIDLVIENRAAGPVTITTGAVSIRIVSPRPACPTGPNFAVSHELTARVTIPPRTSKSLLRLGVPERDWPVVTMVETNATQDACAGMTLRLVYTARTGGA